MFKHSVAMAMTAVHFEAVTLLLWHPCCLVVLISYSSLCHLGDNCIQNLHLRRYSVGYTVGNLVLRRPASEAIICDFRTYIRRYTSPSENFKYGYPHSDALLQFCLKFESCKSHKAARHPTKCDVINEVKLFRKEQIFDVTQSDVEFQKQVH